MTGTLSLLRAFVRRDRWWYLWWGLAVAVLYVSQGWSVDGLYTTQAELDRAAAGMGGNPALVAFCWAAVGIPLAFGIWKTLEKALVLFA